MKKVKTTVILVLLVTALISACARHADKYRAGDTSAPQNILVGKDVVSNDGERLGTISDVVIDPQTNQASIAVVSGDALGIGDKLIPVPVNAFMRSGDNVILNMSKSQLAGAPSYQKNDLPSLSDRARFSDTYRFFGVSPQWERNGTNMDMNNGATGTGFPRTRPYGSPGPY